MRLLRALVLASFAAWSLIAEAATPALHAKKHHNAAGHSHQGGSHHKALTPKQQRHAAAKKLRHAKVAEAGPVAGTKQQAAKAAKAVAHPVASGQPQAPAKWRRDLETVEAHRQQQGVDEERQFAESQRQADIHEAYVTKTFGTSPPLPEGHLHTDDGDDGERLAAHQRAAETAKRIEALSSKEGSKQEDRPHLRPKA